MNEPLRDPSEAVEDTSTRHRILVATAEVLARSGQTKLSLSEVALQAGVSRPTLYRWFASKQELLDAFGIYEREMFDTGISQATAGLRGTEKLDAALRFIVDYQHSYSGVRLVDIEPEVVIGQLGTNPADHAGAPGEAADRAQRSGQGGHRNSRRDLALHRAQRRRRPVPGAASARGGDQAAGLIVRLRHGG